MYRFTQAFITQLSFMGLPEWTGVIIFPLIGAVVIAVIYFVVSYLFYGYQANESKKFLKDGVKTTARYVSGRSEYKENRRSSENYREEKFYFVTHAYTTEKGETIEKEEITRSRQLSEDYRKEAPFEVYYLPNNPKKHKRASEMTDIEKFKKVPGNAVKVFIITFVVILIIMVVGLFTEN